MRFPQDDRRGAFHLGAFAGERLVGIATVAPEDASAAPGRAARLRGMAVEDAWQGRGVGSVLFEAVVEQVRAAGFEILWAEARDTALGFYVRHGMTVAGDGFVNETGLPHHLVLLVL